MNNILLLLRSLGCYAIGYDVGDQPWWAALDWRYFSTMHTNYTVSQKHPRHFWL